jgi:hypothetical protein
MTKSVTATPPAERHRAGDSIRTALAVLAASRTTIFLVGYLAVLVFGYAGGRPPVRDFDSELLNLPSRFDARWYLQIATSGYAYDPRAAPDVQQNIVFFPAFPMAIRAAAAVGGGGPLASTVAGTLLSLVAFGAALVYLHKLAGEIVGGDGADATLWLLAFYPFAFVFGAIYTESFFLLAVVGACYHFRRDQLARAALWGLMAGLTRPNGFLIAVPLGIQAIVRLRSQPSARRASTVVLTLIAVAAPCAGVLAYSGYLWSRTGDPLIWARGHLAWGRSYQGLGALVADRYRMIANGGLGAYLAALPHDALNALGALFAIATAFPVAWTIGPEYALWMLLTILPPLAAGGLISAGRFSSVLFPSFLWLASAIPSRPFFEIAPPGRKSLTTRSNPAPRRSTSVGLSINPATARSGTSPSQLEERSRCL